MQTVVAPTGGRVAVALEAVATAARLSEELAERGVIESVRKRDGSLVTVADFSAQVVIASMIHREFPSDQIVMEESARDLTPVLRAIVVAETNSALGRVVRDADVDRCLNRRGRTSHVGFWTIDPIDGTSGYIRGGQYAIAVAYIECGVPVLGLLACPRFQRIGLSDGVIAVAAKYGGAVAFHMDGRTPMCRLAVDDVTVSADAVICESAEHAHSDHGLSAAIKAALGARRETLQLDSQAKYLAVACGQASCYVRLPTNQAYRERIWDHAAGMLIVEEAGGRVTDVCGRPLDFSHGERLEANRGVIATNGALHDAVVEAYVSCSAHRDGVGVEGR